MYLYEIYTTIPRNFDPEVEGVTLASIIETMRGVTNWSAPLTTKSTIIRIETERPIDEKYLREQLRTEFGEWDGKNTSEVVTEIRRSIIYS